MPITVEEINALTDEQLTPEIEAALLPKIADRALAYLNNNGHVAKKKEDYEAEVTEKVKTENQKAIDAEAAKFFSSIDNMLKLVTGKDKPEKMRTRQWVEQLDEEGLLPFTEKQIEKAKKALKGEGVSGSAAEALANQIKQQFEDYKKEVETGKKTDFEKTVKRVVDSALKNAPVPVDPSLKTEADKATARKAAVADVTAVFNTLYEGAEDDNGVMFFKKRGTDTPLMNTVTGEPMTPLEIIQKNHPIYLAAQQHQQKGGGTNPPAGGGGTGDAKTLPEIRKEASEKHKIYSPEWNKYVKEKAAEAGIKI